jgi:hypothetical protein
MSIAAGCLIGFIAWFLVRYLVAGLYTVNQNERAVKTSFGRAERVQNLTTLDDPVPAASTTVQCVVAKMSPGALDCWLDCSEVMPKLFYPQMDTDETQMKKRPQMALIFADGFVRDHRRQSASFADNGRVSTVAAVG